MSQIALASLHANLHTQLPAEYIEFISTLNGGSCVAEAIELEGGAQVLCDCLFGFGLQSELNLEFWQQELQGELPQGGVAIGSSPGGGFFLLMPQDHGWGLWYYDYSHSLASSSNLNNTYQCQVSLSSLLGKVSRPFNA